MDWKKPEELLNRILNRLDSMDQRFDAMEKRFDSMDRRFGANDGRFDSIENRLGNLEKVQLLLPSEQNEMRKELDQSAAISVCKPLNDCLVFFPIKNSY